MCNIYFQKKVIFLITVRVHLGFFFETNPWDRSLDPDLGWWVTSKRYLQRRRPVDPVRHWSTKSLGFGAFRQGPKVQLQAGGYTKRNAEFFCRLGVFLVGWLKPAWVFFSTLKKTKTGTSMKLKHMKWMRNTLLTDMIQLDILKYTIDVYWCWCFFLSFCWSWFCPFFRHLFSARNHRQGSMQRRQSEPIDPGTPPPSSPSGFDKQRRNYFSCFDCNGCGCSF